MHRPEVPNLLLAFRNAGTNPVTKTLCLTVRRLPTRSIDHTRTRKNICFTIAFRALPRRVIEAWTLKVPKVMAQYATIREHRQYGVHYFAAILPILPVLEYWAIILGILELPLDVWARRPPPLRHSEGSASVHGQGLPTQGWLQAVVFFCCPQGPEEPLVKTRVYTAS